MPGESGVDEPGRRVRQEPEAAETRFSFETPGQVVLTRVVTRPESYRAGSDDVGETWLTVGWDGVRRVDLEPAGCDDPQCEADHGYTGTLAGDDLTVRMSAAADGPDRVARLVRFSTTLQRAAAV